jgi:hypothetical protein
LKINEKIYFSSIIKFQLSFKQCYGNKIHACAIDHIQVNSFQKTHTRETLTVEYINCLMTGVFPEQSYETFARECAEKTEVKNFDSILKCANDTEGSKLLQQAGETTFKLMDPLKNVPTITIRESFDANIQKRSLDNFSMAVCENLPKPLPKYCSTLSSAGGISSSLILSVVAIFTAIFHML